MESQTAAKTPQHPTKKQKTAHTPEGMDEADNAMATETGTETKEPRKQGQKRAYTVQFKIEVLEESKKLAVSNTDIKEKFGVPVRTLQKWKKKEAELRQLLGVNKGNFLKVMEDPLDRVKQAVDKWYDLNQQQPKGCRLPVNANVISAQANLAKETLLDEHKARPFLTELEVEALTDFKASVSWARKAAARFGWKILLQWGKAGDVDVVKVIKPHIDVIIEKMKNVGLTYTYIMDEACLFFKLLPSWSCARMQYARNTRGMKSVKDVDRITTYICTNCDGSDKAPLAVIGKVKNPRCFRGRTLPFQYYHQKRACSDKVTFEKWWEEFRAHIKRTTTQKVLLIMDECGPHGTMLKDPDDQIEVVFLPPNCTSVFRPMDAGIIEMLKRFYRYEMLHRVLDMFEERAKLRGIAEKSNMQAETKGLEQGLPPHIYDAMVMLQKVWNDKVTPKKIQSCWKKAQLWVEESNEIVAESATDTLDAPEVPESDTTAIIASLVLFAGDHENNENREVQLSGSGARKTAEDDFDMQIAEMVECVEDFTNANDLACLINDWVEIEEQEYIQEMIAEESQVMMDMEVILGINKTVAAAAEEANDDDEENTDLLQATDEQIDDITTQMLSLSVRLASLQEPFHDTAGRVQDLAYSIRATHKKVKAEQAQENATSNWDQIFL